MNEQPAGVPDQPERAVRLSERDRERVASIKRQTDLSQSGAVLQYGVEAQGKISEFTDQVLGEVRAKDVGAVGDMLTDLLLHVKSVKVNRLAEGPGFLASLPLVGGLFDRIKRFMAEYQTLSSQIDQIAGRLDRARGQLLQDVGLLDKLFEQNVLHFKDLEVYIQAGEERLAEFRHTTLPEARARAEASGDPIDVQRADDLDRLANRFEKRLHDLKLSKTVSLQTLPQIRLIQAGNQELAEKIQSSILNTIPLWKNQMVIAIGLMRQKKALELQREVSATTDELLRRNAELLRESTVEIAKEAEKGIVDVETLRKVNTDLITTIEEVIRIQQEGRNRRRQAEQELGRLEQELKDKLAARRD
jgi:uncharacterized protein YaaN involved in tellurite resistance